jgi:thioredoxin-like negative regulator of GroEL
VAASRRVEELRRRVREDPASLAFAQLAEEHRRAGEYQEAIRICRGGLARHPSYLSARVTLGRALVEIGCVDEAQRELEEVLRTAPDNLAATRALADIGQRRRIAVDAGKQWPSAVLDTPAAADSSVHPDAAASPDVDPLSAHESRTLHALESWLAAIVRDRARRDPGPPDGGPCRPGPT